VRFAVRAADVDETPRPDEPPRAYVLRLAREKAAVRVDAGEVVLAADTAVVVDGEILGKPADDADARRMLRRLSGREHTVLTGIALAERPPAGEPRLVADVDEARVRMAALSDEEIAWYAATGEPRDKAGAYAIQGLGALFVEGIEGSFSNVVGLPIARTYRLFAASGHPLLAFRTDD
jgi:septum formation protein